MSRPPFSFGLLRDLPASIQELPTSIQIVHHDGVRAVTGIANGVRSLLPFA